MYRQRKGQLHALEPAAFFGGVVLDPSNQWVRLAEITPWDAIEQEYAMSFEGIITGNPAKSARMAIGTLIIKERYGFSDEDVVEEIRMNPYLQYYIGRSEFSHKAPFDASTITRFRKRATPEMLAAINDLVIGRAKRGTMILDATCAPQNIRFPTDLSLLNEAWEKLEAMIDTVHTAGLTEGKKPRTYRKRARKDYLRYARNRKPTLKLLRKSLRKQLGYVARDLSHLDSVLNRHPDALSARQMETLSAIRRLYMQQREMYDQGTRTVKDRIVSISQPHVRPIVRGKAGHPTEFGAKIEASLVDRYLRIEMLSWDAFNEGGTLQASVERFRADTGQYPSRILADKIFRTRENLDYCKAHGIRMNGPKLGRPPKDKALYREQLQIERQESGECSAIECAFGVGKRRYTLGCVMTHLQHTSEVSIHGSVLAMNLFRKLRLSFRVLICWLWDRFQSWPLLLVG